LKSNEKETAMRKHSEWVAMLLLIVVLAAAIVIGCSTTTRPQKEEYQALRVPPQGNPAAANVSEAVDSRLASKLGAGKSQANRSTSPRDLLPQSSLPARDEELWVIAKPKADAAPRGDDQPKAGALGVVKDEQFLPCPLKHTGVQARVDGYVASTVVTQQFENPFSEKIEATYLFPLPENAAVSEFTMTIGDRKIRGIVREREEAKQIYEAAKSQGYTAALLEQERPNVFSQKVANIEPGKRIDVSLRYFQTLAYVDGWHELVFPMTIGPRFNPPGTTDGMGALPRGTTGGPQPANVTYLASGERTGHDVSLTVDLAAGVAIEEVKSVNHAIEVESVSADQSKIKLAGGDRVLNRDFVLRWRVAGGELKTATVAQRGTGEGGGDGYFSILLVPPVTTDDLPRAPVELCFVLDVSGSMTGAPMQQSKAAITAALDLMRPGDTFNVIRFAGASDQLSSNALEATPANIRRAKQFIERTEAGGGTMMLEGITRALSKPTDMDRVRYVCMMTDGFIGNEAELISATSRLRGRSRVFGFGVGSAPNRYLLDGMSRAGGGAVAYLSLNDRGEDVMRPFFERISRPVLRDIAVDTSALGDVELAGGATPDVYVGRAVVITGKFKGDGGNVVVRGTSGGRPFERSFAIAPKTADTALASVWARQKIAALCDAAAGPTDDAAGLGTRVRQVALEYGLLSPFTSFVAVDSSHVTAGNHGTSVDVPAMVPQGVRYETTVGGATAH
jgi:Ca-activated chloride channel family protein